MVRLNPNTNHAEGSGQIELDRSREAALQAYLARMTQLLPEEGRTIFESASRGDNGTRARVLAMVRPRKDEHQETSPSTKEPEQIWDLSPRAKRIARKRTLAVLVQLDGKRKGTLVRQLYRWGLIGKDAVIDLKGADLSTAELADADLWGINLANVNLQRVQLRDARLPAAILRKADLRHADVSGADLWAADLREADLTGISADRANLGTADLSKAYLHKAALSRANLSRAKLVESDLSLANLSGANLSGADLQRTILWGNNLNEADLSGADLSGADLSGADLTRADLTETNLKWAKVSEQQLAVALSLQGATRPDGTVLG
jgi:uncharacterized protein YjbI with pentapeptide repeats